MTLLVRSAEPADAEAVHHVYVQAWTHLARTIMGLTGERFAPELAHLHPTFVAEVDGGVVGFCQTRRDWVERLYVLPSHHRTGVGSLLLSAAETVGGRHLWVDEANTPGRRFYESHGWHWDGISDPGMNWPEYRVLRYTRVNRS